MTIAPDEYRRVMRQWYCGVTIVTLRAGSTIHGLTVSAFTSVSLHPPMVMVCLGTDRHSHELMDIGKCFAVNILGHDQLELSNRFAGLIPGVVDRLVGIPWHTAATGAPILDDCLAWLDCTLVAAYPGGDHIIYLGQVEAANTEWIRAPLIYGNGGYHLLVPEPD